MTILLLHLYFFVLAATLTIIYTEADGENHIRNQRRRLRPIDNDNGTGDNERYNTEKDDDLITGLQTYIVNGNDSSRGRHPYQAMLFRETGPNARFGCGGSLIASDLVLSAAHCGIPKQVEIGRDSRVEDNGNFDRRDVLYSYKHPRNDKQSYAYDMLLLKLSAPSTKRPIRMNDNPTLPIVNQLVTVTGFGKMAYNGVPSDTLREVELNAISNDVCSQSKDLDSKREDYQRGYEGLIQDNMLCLSDLSNSRKDACSGDSGGPAIIRGNTSEEDIQVGKLEDVHCIFDTVACYIHIYLYMSDPVLIINFVLFLFLKGIVSWGYECALPNFPGVYAGINHSIVWLRSSACIMSDQPQDDFNCDSFASSRIINDPNGTPMINITIKIEFALYPDRISWAFTDAQTMETIAYRSSFDYSLMPSGTYYEEVVSLPAGSFMTYTIYSNGNNGLQTFSVGYYDYDGIEMSIMAGRGGGDSDQDTASTDFVLPSSPTAQPTPVPSMKPTENPSSNPTDIPSVNPTIAPTPRQSGVPSDIPSVIPSLDPSSIPTNQPTDRPTISSTNAPSVLPTTPPTVSPTDSPSASPTDSPTLRPTQSPTRNPTREPSQLPTVKPTISPTNGPTRSPTFTPTKRPSLSQTTNPTRRPTDGPTKRPTNEPSIHPSEVPSSIPSLVEKPPTKQPSRVPTLRPSSNPSTSAPTAKPTKSLIKNLIGNNSPSRREKRNNGTPTESPAPSSTMFPTKGIYTKPSVTSTTSVLPSSKGLSDRPSIFPTDISSSNATDIDSDVSSSNISLVPIDGPSSIPSKTGSDDMAVVTTDGLSDHVSDPIRSMPSTDSSISSISSSNSVTAQNISGCYKLIFKLTLSWMITMVL
jgi:hypothetical protein